MIGHNCNGGPCPTVFKSDRGTFVVQGFQLAGTDMSQLTLGPNESAVEIPEALMNDVLSALGK
jgi:hypothetical protein